MDFIAEQVVKLMEEIPPEKRHLVLHYANELRHKYGNPKPFQSLEGLWADLGIDLSAEEIDDLRREAWAMSPKREA